MSATAGRRRRRGTGHELREVVLAAASDLLAALGDVDALTMRTVAAASGVTPPSVYRHFPNKNALVQAVIAERFAEFTETLQAAAATGERPLERLEAMSRAYVRFGDEHPGHYRVLFSATNAGPAGLGLTPEVEHPGAASHRALVDAVSACLPAARREQAVPLATELWASLHGMVDLRITKPDMPWPGPDTLIDPALTPIRVTAAG
ncbi:MAG: TetR/AcrR family transcriptional regulator [Solirubrobacterales bacterium]|nr:TetR/AcrR family transcriptional regulator [Solirubrobacterales bacterium]